MKIKGMKYVGMIAALLAMFSLTSCEVEIDEWFDDDHYSDIYYENTGYLCSRTWISSWRNKDGEFCTQYLDFYRDRRGRDRVIVEHYDGCVTEDVYTFEWHWDNRSQTCIRMIYGPNDVSYFEDIRMGGNTLWGWLDGDKVEFKGN